MIFSVVIFLPFISLVLSSSSDTPLVSGIINATKSNCKIIIKAKMANTVPAPMEVKRTGTNEGIIAAKIQ